ncbi:bifunctional 4-hydroxy-2-oxoglutarate aldolase/2-dehydro-3-deoxy-phosphogluconate aldolase [Chitinophaga sp. MM2321]|uniref:bifunctional 4-hydroxy-2-oxoglutarate aldolase/2-dehydro-3-deoxy-phosphogluconate aldolase n=1 Tax=Chitinophaga sp. MM2321 TaxID=3137178 RepID=UPI0032D58BA0
MKMNNKFSWETFNAMPVVGIMRNFPADIVAEIIPFYQKAGFTTLEITMNSDGAADIISELVDAYPDLNIGAGTVCEVDELQIALKAGASFIVTPILNEAVITHCVEKGIPVFPGALTPTEIYRSWKLGADVVKIFPATQFGPAYLKELKGPLNKIKLLPTGGVSLDNIAAFFKAGATGVGMGSTLFDKQMMAKKDYAAMSQHFKNIADRVKQSVGS